MLLTNDVCRNQAFIYNKNVLAFQCHLEVTPVIINDLVNEFHDELDKGGKYVQDSGLILKKTGTCLEVCNRAMRSVLAGF